MILKHITGQPFIFATGLAALIHSTWSLGTLFAGSEPAQLSLAWFAWVIPALLIAFSLDVGQIVTSAEIRAGQRTPAKYATFLVFAVATYYLQWVYVVHHIPALDLSAGVRTEWRQAVGVIGDAAIWLYPLLLPLSTTLYTASHTDKHQLESHSDRPPAVPIHSPEPDAALPTPAATPALPELVDAPEMADDPVIEGEVVSVDASAYRFHCDKCGYDKHYPNLTSATQAQRAHKRYCPAVNSVTPQVPVQVHA